MEIDKAVNKHLLGTRCTEVDPKYKSKTLKYRFKGIYFSSYVALFFSSYSPDKMPGLTLITIMQYFLLIPSFTAVSLVFACQFMYYSFNSGLRKKKTNNIFWLLSLKSCRLDDGH